MWQMLGRSRSKALVLAAPMFVAVVGSAALAQQDSSRPGKSANRTPRSAVPETQPSSIECCIDDKCWIEADGVCDWPELRAQPESPDRAAAGVEAWALHQPRGTNLSEISGRGDFVANMFDASGVILVAAARLERAVPVRGAWLGTEGHIVTDCHFSVLTEYKRLENNPPASFRLAGGRLSETEWEFVSHQPTCDVGSEVLLMLTRIDDEVYLAAQDHALVNLRDQNGPVERGVAFEQFVRFLAEGGDL
ncbi:MAG: hypothetical protein AB2A00_26030 [Myxococcota bacterium]